MSDKISIISNGGKNTFIELVNSIEDSISKVSEYKTHWLPLNPQNKVPYGDINIIIYGRNLILPKYSFNILIQTEQLNNRKNKFQLGKYDFILDIFPNTDGIYLPLSYSKYFDNSFECDEDIDFFFYGGRSDRRSKIIEKYNIYCERKVFGKERNDLIQRAKWNINIKNDNNWNYTPLRGILTMSKGKILLQEEINNKQGYGYHDQYLIKFNENNLLDIVFDWKDIKKRKEFGMYIKESLMKNPFEDIFLEKLNKGFK